ncbi:polysaccharide deacetylase family protein [Glutamicibacter sp.]|uniref:polysaccharide deacetylase family protein n=1 Tax=Glutamicibacter sp. TaxID=1931995 RepID=UPI002B485FEC|nr:polysaccharide deacetylase family protein [Glutamicibacter sp.]HJX79553.1 polysaccharide deacetylase family protein [Glutamicibacter sp.]
MQSNTPVVNAGLSRRRLLRFALGGGAGAVGLLGLAALSGCTKSPENSATSAAGQASAPATASASVPASDPTKASASAEPLFSPSLSKKEATAQFGQRAPGQFGLEIPGIQLALPSGVQGVALTFDACGGAHGSKMDHQLIEVLRTHKTPATLFVNQRWARSNPKLLTELIADPLFEIANHGTKHAPLSVAGQQAYGIPGTGSVAQAYDEIVLNQRYLAQEFDVQARFFRSGTAHMDQVGVALCRKLGLVPMNFTVNMDAGATFPAASVAAQVSAMKPGDVGIGHFNQPNSGTARGIDRGLKKLADNGIKVLRLTAA